MSPMKAADLLVHLSVRCHRRSDRPRHEVVGAQHAAPHVRTIQKVEDSSDVEDWSCRISQPVVCYLAVRKSLKRPPIRRFFYASAASRVHSFRLTHSAKPFNFNKIHTLVFLC